MYYNIYIKERKVIKMNEEKYDFIMKRLNEHYEYLISKGYEVVCLMLQGSQNYGLDEYSDEYQSDIDSKAIVLPHFCDFVYEKAPISYTEILDNNEHIDVKDIRIMFEMFTKENISYIELLYTPYRVVNAKYLEYIRLLFDNRESIAAINTNQFLRCIVGMAGNKVKALCHRYPTLEEKIDKYGFDGKQLSHLVWLFEFISRYTKGESIEKCYLTQEPEMLKNLKKQLTFCGDRVMTVDEAVAAAQFYYEQTKLIERLHLLPHDVVNKEPIELLNKIKYDKSKTNIKSYIVIKIFYVWN